MSVDRDEGGQKLKEQFALSCPPDVSRGTGSLLTPGSIDEAEEDLQPAGNAMVKQSLKLRTHNLHRGGPVS